MFTQTVPDWLIGVWKRLSIEEGGNRDTTTQVIWIQTSSGFADIRIPASRTAIEPIARYSHQDDSKYVDQNNLDDDLTSLNRQQAELLCQQEGFAGITQFTNGLCEWQRALDYTPFTGELDRGTLHWEGDILIEIGPDGAYKEEWQRIATGPTTTMTATNGLRWEKWLVTCGDYFIYICDRRQHLPANTTLLDLLHARPDEEIETTSQEYLNCEVSLGRIRSGSVAWEIQQSTLPWKEKTRLWQAEDFSIDRSNNRAIQTASQHQTTWDIQEWGNLQQLLGHSLAITQP